MRECSAPGCHVLLPAAGRCAAHIKARDEQVKAADKARGTAHARGYTSAWSKARTGFLARHPLCVLCEKKGILTSANVVDHVRPHKGDKVLFWDRGNWQALCKPCHDSKTAKEDGAWGRPIIAK